MGLAERLRRLEMVVGISEPCPACGSCEGTNRNNSPDHPGITARCESCGRVLAWTLAITSADRDRDWMTEGD
jgi:hypothetical protein